MNIEQYEQEARENSAQFLSEMNIAKFAEWTENYIVDLSLAGTAFKAIIRQGEDKDRAIIIPGEFGNWRKNYRAAARGEVIRQYVQSYTNTDPSLIILPNSTLGEDNLNLTLAERNILKTGSAAPLVDRMNKAVEYVMGEQEGETTVLGPSQGAVPALAYGAKRERTAVAVTENPGVKKQSISELIYGMLSSSGLVKEEVAANFKDSDILGKELVADLTNPLGMARYLLGGLTRPNIAIIKMLLHGTADAATEAVLANKGSVVQAYAGSGVSPLEANRAIARKYQNNPRFMNVEFLGHDHSVTNDIHASAALVRAADELRNLPDETQ